MLMLRGHQADVLNKRQRARQKVDEKVAIANQTLNMIENHIRKLDSDLQILGHQLRNTGEFQSSERPVQRRCVVLIPRSLPVALRCVPSGMRSWSGDRGRSSGHAGPV